VAINQNFQQLDFFTRAPRDVSKDVIDWSEITGKFVDFINIERDRRMAAKAEIDKNISTTLATMDNLDVGMDVEFNNWMFEGANNMRQYLLTQEKLLKSGQISVAQFKRNLSNTEGTVTNFKNYTTQYNQAVTKREQMRMGVDEEGNPIDGGSILSRGDEWLTQHTGRYMDFGGTELVIGKDGTGGVVFTTGDPTAPYETNSLQSMGNLINMSQQMFTKYDYFSDITGFVDEIGKVTQGNYRRSETSEKFNEAYEPAKADYISSIVDSPSKLQSLASDHLPGIDIFDRYTTDESKMNDPNALVFINQGGNLVPAMDSKGWQEVRAKAVEFLSYQIDLQTELTMKEAAPTPRRNADQKDNTTELYNRLTNAFATGNVSDFQVAAQTTGYAMTFDPSSGTATFGGRPYNINDPEERRNFFLAAGQTTGNLDIAASRYSSSHASGGVINTGSLMEATPPESYDDGSSSNFESSSGGDRPSMMTEGGRLVPLNEPASNLGFGDEWADDGKTEDIRINNSALLDRAFVNLAMQLDRTGGSASIETIYDDDNNNYIVKDGKGNVLATIGDNVTSNQIDREIQKAYQANLN
jgi:hypothetical protein